MFKQQQGDWAKSLKGFGLKARSYNRCMTTHHERTADHVNLRNRKYLQRSSSHEALSEMRYVSLYKTSNVLTMFTLKPP